MKVESREEGGWRSARMEDLVEEWNPMTDKNGSRKIEISKRRLKESSAPLVKFCYMKCNVFSVQEENKAGKDSCRQCML